MLRDDYVTDDFDKLKKNNKRSERRENELKMRGKIDVFDYLSA